MINYEAISETEVTKAPFEFFTTQEVLDQNDLEAIRADFPKIEKPGIFPLSSLDYGPAFSKLIDDIQSSNLRDIMSEKFGVNLTGMPLMITVRGQAQKKDGRIHSDTKEKVVTCLLYLNDKWDHSGGRLRLLNNGNDIEDYAAEISPNGGTLAAFKVAWNSWHGHKPFSGERRYIMFNWVVSEEALARQIDRHKFSAKIKKFIPFFYRGTK